ncbi:MAG: hypothetical protein KDN18_11165 [Verrucomicrobiae bacterium]|nr:hypothetical protein [Verrucomicrobiae bacterium]
MKTSLVLALALVGVAFGEDLSFDPKKPVLLVPGKTYSFVITPRKDAKEIRIRLHAEASSEFRSEDGRPFAPIDKLSVEQGDERYELTYDYTDVGVPHMDIADFDGDGDLDFRIITAWGTGGSWYCYYRFHDGRYERWEEPEELGLNGMPDNGFLTANGRSGPEFSSVSYRFKDGRFQKQRVEAILLRDSLAEFKDKKMANFVSVSVTEEWDDTRLVRRVVEPQYEPK